jgi:hypothetical protein
MTQSDPNQSFKTLSEEAYAQAEQFGAKALEAGRQLAELTLDASEQAAKSGADLYVKAASALPYPWLAEAAKAQAEWALRATEVVVRSGRELVAK